MTGPKITVTLCSLTHVHIFFVFFSKAKTKVFSITLTDENS